MNQTRLESLVEASINTASGFVVAMLVTQYIVVPLWNLQWTPGDSAAVTLVYTVVAVARGYVWRRFFNAGLHRVVHGWFA